MIHLKIYFTQMFAILGHFDFSKKSFYLDFILIYISLSLYEKTKI